jgi:hypothetical protein
MSELLPEVNKVVTLLNSHGYKVITVKKNYVDRVWTYEVLISFTSEEDFKKLLNQVPAMLNGNSKISLIYNVMSNGRLSKPFISISFTSVPKVKLKTAASSLPKDYGKK